MNAEERGLQAQQIVNAVYSALDAEGLIVHRTTQVLVKATMCGAVIDALYGNAEVDLQKWKINEPRNGQ